MFKWIKESNRWKHLIVGFIISLGFGFSSAAIAMLAVEWKDKSWGGEFDQLDIAAGLIGAVIGTFIRFIILYNMDILLNKYLLLI